MRVERLATREELVENWGESDQEGWPTSAENFLNCESVREIVSDVRAGRGNGRRTVPCCDHDEPILRRKDLIRDDTAHNPRQLSLLPYKLYLGNSPRMRSPLPRRLPPRNQIITRNIRQRSDLRVEEVRVDVDA